MKAAILFIALLWNQAFSAIQFRARSPIIRRARRLPPGLPLWAAIGAFAALLASNLSTTGQADPTPAAVPDSERLTDNSTPADVFESMRKGFKVAAAKGVHARYQFNLSGPV